VLKRGCVSLPQALAALDANGQITLTLIEVDLEAAVELSARFNLYAYDAYMIVCAQHLSAPLLTLDGGLRLAARTAGVIVEETIMQTYPDTNLNLSTLLEEVARTGGVRIRREDGQSFLLTPAFETSPLDIPGIDLRLTADEIVAAVREVRERA